MRILVIAVAMLLSLANSAFAEPVSMTNEEIISVFTGLSQLDSYNKVVKEGDKEQVVKEPYQLSGVTRLAIARNLAKLELTVKALQKVRQQILQQYGGKIEPGTENETKFVAEVQKVLIEKQDIDLTKIKTSELDLDHNPIPASVLRYLSPILSD